MAKNILSLSSQDAVELFLKIKILNYKGIICLSTSKKKYANDCYSNNIDS